MHLSLKNTQTNNKHYQITLGELLSNNRRAVDFGSTQLRLRDGSIGRGQSRGELAVYPVLDNEKSNGPEGQKLIKEEEMLTKNKKFCWCRSCRSH